MKKTLLLLCAISTSYFFGQTPITINSSDLPVVGTQMININNLDITTVNVGAAGENQIFDFSTFQNYGEDTILYITPSETDYPTNFPNSNFVTLNTTDSTLNFFNSSSTQLNLQGFFMDIPQMGRGLITASDPLEQLNLPTTYDDNFTDTSDLMTQSIAFYQDVPGVGYFDSVRAKVTIYRTSTIDAWGTMITPFGSSFPILRQVVEDITLYEPQANMYLQDTLFGTPVEIPLGYQAIPGVPAGGDTTMTFYYLTNSDSETPMTLAEIQKNNLGMVISAKYAKMAMVSNGLNDLSKLSFTIISPNPATSSVNIESIYEIKSIKLISFDGKELLNRTTNSKKISLDLLNYNTGIYTIILETEKGQEIKKINKL